MAFGLKFHWYLKTLSLKFQKARTKIEVFSSSYLAPAMCSILGAENRQMFVLRPFYYEIKDDTKKIKCLDT